MELLSEIGRHIRLLALIRIDIALGPARLRPESAAAARLARSRDQNFVASVLLWRSLEHTALLSLLVLLVVVHRRCRGKDSRVRILVQLPRLFTRHS